LGDGNCLPLALREDASRFLPSRGLKGDRGLVAQLLELDEFALDTGLARVLRLGYGLVGLEPGLLNETRGLPPVDLELLTRGYDRLVCPAL